MIGFRLNHDYDETMMSSIRSILNAGKIYVSSKYVGDHGYHDSNGATSKTRTLCVPQFSVQ